ncbi:hypothetical protein DH2020_021076 [Rehmannia glutinosa]|uniref:Uncharacterized protein n=1 Tax=Rehmannia glutinosa TaxID=99300 RepID=A0ABR0WCC5_REHGL
MVNNGSKAGVSTAPPHELNVWKFVESRASELEGLHTIIAERLDNNFRSQRNKRRRTTGHDNRVAKKKLRKRRRVGVGEKGETDLVREDEKKVPRCVQRNIELKKNPPSGFGTSGDGTKRLRTHVWHAKRFTMKKLWGFYVPLGLHGRGRGSRALLKKLKHGVLAHDASYYGPVQLEGPEASISDTLMSVLSSVLVPSPSACCEETLHDILAGATFGTAMLHHAGKPCFSPIAPATYMWRPLQQISTNEERLSTDVSDGERNIDDGIIIRQLWIWIHAAACEEAYDSLSSVCERQVDTTRSAHCFSRGGQLAKLELVGSKVFELLQKTLIPASCNFDKSWHLKKCSGDEHDDPVEPEKTSIFENGHQISSTAVVSMVVKDPRALTKKGNVIVPEEKPHGLLSNEEFQIKEQISSSLPKNVAEGVHQYGDLWDASKGVLPPVEESVLCMEKHHRRKEFIRLGHKRSGPQKALVDGKYSRVCPILLLRNETNEDSVTRCSIILPLSWVKAFWITFMSNGAHAIGLREKHWVACEIGLPYFPFDFPDCNAYSNFMAMEAVEINQKERLRPPSKRPLEVPIPPPWDCVRLTLGKRSSKAGNSHSQVEEISAQNEKNDDMEKKSAFEGIIARTSCILSDYLNNTNGSHFLLFPRKSDQKDNLCKFMRDKEFLKQDTVISEVKCGETLYYLRVLLRACKEGVFEQGAVVCAPLPSDIMLLKSSSESDDQRLQIPQSSLKSYFTQLPSGKWELQIPEDKAVHESYSKKATAGALCEASLLSMLRAEQWKTLPVRQRKKEIYVLVRNMRSTAYRLALATIVLEQQEEDVQFM